MLNNTFNLFYSNNTNITYNEIRPDYGLLIGFTILGSCFTTGFCLMMWFILKGMREQERRDMDIHIDNSNVYINMQEPSFSRSLSQSSSRSSSHSLSRS